MNIEQLEQRRLYAVTVSEGYPGFYEVNGDASANTINISVSQNDDTFTLDGATYSNVQHVAVQGFGGNDSIDVQSVDGSGLISASIDGGDGNNTLALNFDGAIWGGDGNDTINISNAFYGEVYGGAGDDIINVKGDCIGAEIHGGEGNDVIDARDNNYAVLIHGDAGDDVIYGSAYDDQLAGDDGNDTVYGMAGNDTFYDTEVAHGGDGHDILYMTSSHQSHDSIEEILNA